MKVFLGIDKIPPVLERSFKVATKLESELATDVGMENIPFSKTRESLENTDIYMQTGK